MRPKREALDTVMRPATSAPERDFENDGSGYGLRLFRQNRPGNRRVQWNRAIHDDCDAGGGRLGDRGRPDVSSVAGLVGIGGMSGYAASKHGVIGLTKSAALEYAQEGIRINAVCPGSLARPSLRFPRVFTEVKKDDGRHPMGCWCKGEEVADAILWLCSDRSSFTTGHALAVDGGWSAR